MKRLSLFIGMLSVALSVLGAIGDKIYSADNVIYEVTSANEVKVMGYTQEFSVTHWEIPRTIESGGVVYTVSAISQFINNTVVESIVVPGSVKAMITNWQGFKGCAKLKKIIFESGFTTLSKGAFQNCTALTEVILPHGLTEIPVYAFQNAGLQTITLPGSTATINSNAFVGCNSLTEIRFDGTDIPSFVRNGDGKNYSTVSLVVPLQQTAAFQVATVANPFKEIREDAALGSGTAPVVWNPLTDIRKDDFLVYIIFGQSNAEGYDAVPSDEDRQPHPDLYNLIAYDNNSAEDGTGTILAPWGEWENVAEPNCRKTKFHPTKLGWAKAFGEEMLARNPGKKIALVHVAVASAAIKLFDKAEYEVYLADANTSKWVKYKALGAYGGRPYRRIIDAAKKAQEYGTIKGILMHQGEEDGNKAYWPASVKKVYQDMLADLSLTADQVPLLLGEPTAYRGAIANQVNITTEGNSLYIPHSHLIPALDLPYNNLHFTREGYVELGKRYAEKATALLQQGGNTTGLLSPFASSIARPMIKSMGNGVLHVSSFSPFTYLKVLTIDGKLLQSVALDNQQSIRLHLPSAVGTPVLLHFTSSFGQSQVVKVRL